MNIHEYQEILASYGVRIQRGIVANSPRSGCCCTNNRNGYKLVYKVHAGGRGKGGGVKLAKNNK
jgi:succinyl-CoA synthetase beta subunit